MRPYNPRPTRTNTPRRAQLLRVLLNELTRISSHLVWLGTHALDIGALTMFLYCWREREDISRIYENISGQRMMSSYFRIGGLALEPPLDFYKQVQDFLTKMPSRVDQYEDMLTGNPIWMGRLKGVGILSAADAIALGRAQVVREPLGQPPLDALGGHGDDLGHERVGEGTGEHLGQGVGEHVSPLRPMHVHPRRGHARHVRGTHRQS